MNDHYLDGSFKPVKKEFFCALCRTPREMKNTPELTHFNYLQILFISLVFAGLTYSWIGFKGILIAIPLWASFEFIKKSLYRKELSCPHCGFDPTWYRRDVKMARTKVANFFEAQKGSQEVDNQLAERIN